MPYRKFKADYLFDGSDFCDAGSVLITDEKGKVIEVTNTKNAGGDIETFAGILSPGFINAHCHLELSHLKNKIPEKTGLVNFVYKVITERHHEAAEIETAIEAAIEEMRGSGIVAIGDICNNELSLPAKKSGRINYYNFIEASGWNPSVVDERFNRSKEIFDVFIADGQKASIVPHAPYSVSYRLWEKITPFFEDKVVTIHSKESKGEDELFLKGEGGFNDMYEKMKIDNTFFEYPGQSSVEYYFEKLSRASSVILVHNTFLNKDDIDHILKHKRSTQLLSFCLCPNANVYIENSLPPVELLIENDLNIIIGT
ncbi:MAG: amidohydrolase family protein, partial [Ginsengibacter sp.]